MTYILFMFRVLFLAINVLMVKETCSAKIISEVEKAKTGDVWLPRELGRFHLKDAAFVEVFKETPTGTTNNQNATVYADQYNLFITTFNAGTLKMSQYIFSSNFSCNLFMK